LACSLSEKNLKIKKNVKTMPDRYLMSKRKYTLVCTKKIRKLGWSQDVDLKTGLSQMIESYRNI